MVLFTAIAVLSVLTVLFILFLKWRNQYWTRKGVPQLNPELFFGDLKPVVTKSVTAQDHFLNIYKQCKAKGLKEIGYYNFTSPGYMPLDLNIIKQIFIKDFEHFTAHGFYSHEKEPITRNLFAMEGEDWKVRRTKFSPTFTTGKMKMMFETLYEKAKILREVVNENAKTGEIRIKETLARFTTDIIGTVAFGIECNSLEEGDNKFRQMGRKLFEPNVLKFLLETFVPHDLLGKTGYRTIPRIVTSYFTRIVQDTVKYREQNDVQRKDFMQTMIQLKNNADKAIRVTDEEMVAESFLFYAAGFETSSSTSTFALLELSQHQDIQDKLRKEIIESLEKNNGKITYELVMEMPYLDQVVKETLRKYPVLAFIPRQCTKTYKVPGTNTVLEKGIKLLIPAWGIHKDPEYYPNPEEFNPENFTSENKAKRPDFTWFPFGEGPRQCIGLRFGLMQTKTALITLLREFRFLPHGKTSWPLQMDAGSVVLAAQGENWLKVEKI